MGGWGLAVSLPPPQLDRFPELPLTILIFHGNGGWEQLVQETRKPEAPFQGGEAADSFPALQQRS